MESKTKRCKKSEYDAVCRELGFSADMRFVEIENGRIGFSCGKPDEVRALLAAARKAGYAVTRSLVAAANR